MKIMKRPILAGLAPMALLSMAASIAVAEPTKLDNAVMDDVTAGGGSISIALVSSTTGGNTIVSYEIDETDSKGIHQNYSERKTFADGGVQVTIVKKSGSRPDVTIRQGAPVRRTGMKPNQVPYLQRHRALQRVLLCPKK